MSYRPSMKWKLAVSSASRFRRRWSAGCRNNGDQMMTDAGGKEGRKGEKWDARRTYDFLKVL